MAPYVDSHLNSTSNGEEVPFVPERYAKPGIIDFIHNLPRYGSGNNVVDYFEGGADKSGYIRGIVISSCVLLVFFLAWCLVLLLFKLYFPSSFLSGRLDPPHEPEYDLKQPRRRRGSRPLPEEEDDDTSSTHSSGDRSGGDYGDHAGKDDQYDDDIDELSIDSTIFWKDPLQHGEELTMAVIAREQRADKDLATQKRRFPKEFSTTTNGRITLITTRDDDDHSMAFRVYIPRSLRVRLLRTYHDCIVHPDNVSNPQSMIYEYFTWNGIRRDVSRYLDRYRASMERGSNAALVTVDRYDDEDDDDDSVDSSDPITLDVIADEQAADEDLQRIIVRAPTVFSTATNGSIQLVTARGKDKKYRIVIPRKLQPKVLRTYHDCLVNPTPENNFEKVLYVHFTWNGIHGDVEEYVRNGGLTEEMLQRDPEAYDRREERRRRRIMRSREEKARREKKRSRRRSLSPRDRLRKEDEDRIESGVPLTRDRDWNNHRDSGDVLMEDDESYANDESKVSIQPIGLDEIAKEQKKDRELRQLKKEEPFVFSTVRYGNTLLTTAQNFRDNKYRIVIPQSLQGRMLLTYRECLLHPTPERNFDTLLYNHFTWNGIHDDVDYFVKTNGRLPRKENYGGVDKESKKKVDKTHTGGDRNHQIDPSQENWEEEYDTFESKVKSIRIVFLLSGLFVIVSSILFLELGVDRVFRSLDDAQNALQIMSNTANEALIVSSQYLNAQSNVQERAKQIGVYNTSQWCSIDTENEFAVQIRDKTYEVGIKLRDTALRVESEVKGVQSDIRGILDTAEDVDSTLDEIKSYATVAKVVVVFIIIVDLCLMLTCVLAWMKRLHFVPILMGNAFIIPLFVILLILFWVFSIMALMGAMAGADFCVLPDETTVNILVQFQSNFNPLMFLLSMYYVTGCLPDRMPLKLDDLSTALNTIGDTVHSITGEVSNAIEQANLAEQCGQNGPTKLLDILGLADASVHVIFDALSGVKGVLECQNFNPIYTTLAYDAVCNSGVGGFSWVFFTSLSIAVFGLVMVTFRVAIVQY